MTTRLGLANLTGLQNLSEADLDLAIYNSIRYLEDTTAMEEELGVVYAEATAVVVDSPTEDDDSGNRRDNVGPQDSSHP